MLTLLESENKSANQKIAKPDFSTKTGREFLSFYLQTKFRQILAYDKHSETPLFETVRDGFLDSFTRRLIMDYQRKILIGITGETSSGKSTICKNLLEVVGQFDIPVEVFSADNYFNDISELIKKYKDFDSLRDSGYDVDAPSSFQLDLLRDDLIKLAHGKDVMIPQYLINGTGISVPNAKPVKAQKIIVVEGMCTMYENLSDMFDIKIYVDIDSSLQKKFFLKRASSRNQSKENALKHWQYAKNAAKKYVIPAKEKADIVVNGGVDSDKYKRLFEYIYKITNNFADV